MLIRFELTVMELQRCSKMRALVYRTLGVTRRQLHNIIDPLHSMSPNIVFIVSPEQFSRFIILRNEMNLSNWIKALQAEIIEERDSQKEIIIRCVRGI